MIPTFDTTADMSALLRPDGERASRYPPGPLQHRHHLDTQKTE